jgi:NADH:ubiquinone oxidoreductase subunit 6 (subunit J)
VGGALSVEQVFFYLISAVVVGAALGVVLMNNVVHAALFLVATLLSIAGLYVLLSAEFLALVQVLLYAGGVIVLVLFALMMTRGRDLPQQMNGAQRPFAVIAGLALIVIIAAAAAGTAWPGRLEEVSPVSFNAIGESLFSTWAVPFEIASLVLLVALVGAIVLARQEGD